MRKTALVLLADGFEDVEAVTPIDVLRRCGVEVTLAGVGKTDIKSARGLRVSAEVRLEDYTGSPDAVILPGGLPGAENLRDSKAVSGLLQRLNEEKKIIAAICAAPALVLSKEGLLSGKKATCYPGYENELAAGKATGSTQGVVTDGRIVTSRGPGTAFAFSFELAKILVGADIAKKVSDAMLATSA